jgi:hypothetical protein
MLQEKSQTSRGYVSRISDSLLRLMLLAMGYNSKNDPSSRQSQTARIQGGLPGGPRHGMMLLSLSLV